MAILGRILFFLATLAAGILIIKYVEPIVRLVGKNDLAEKYLGAGGTYTMWKIIALIVILVGFLFMLGRFRFF